MTYFIKINIYNKKYMTLLYTVHTGATNCLAAPRRSVNIMKYHNIIVTDVSFFLW